MKKILLITLSLISYSVLFSQNTSCLDDDCCLNGTVWDSSLQGCVGSLNGDFDGDLCITALDLLGFLAAFGTCQTVFSCGDDISHDGYSYSTIEIGDQCWFQENSRYLPEVSPSSDGSYDEAKYYVYDYEGTDVNIATSTSNYTEYGVLYNHKAVVTQGVCPSGWHIPTDIEWQEMELFLGMTLVEASSTGFRGTDQGDQLKSDLGWTSGNGTNSTQFTALPGGHLIFSSIPMLGGFGDLGTGGNWWTLPEIGEEESYRRHLKFYEDKIYRDNYNNKSGFSVRCIKGSGPNYVYGCTDAGACNYDCTANTEDDSCYYIGDSCNDGDENTTDDFIQSDCNCTGYGLDPWTDFVNCGDDIMHEGYAYSTTIVGDQCWFSENCRYLPAVNDVDDGSSIDPKYYVYDYQGGDVTAASNSYNYNKYGVLYNYPAVIDPAVCPSGWHIPTETDFGVLQTYVGGVFAGEHIKSTWDWDWWPGACADGNGLDTYGFTGLPAGMRSEATGTSPEAFQSLHEVSPWWSVSNSVNDAYYLSTNFNCDPLHIQQSNYHGYTNSSGFSARCLMDNNLVVCTNPLSCNYGAVGPCITPGSPCNDGDPNTLNDTYQSDCSCSGTTSIPFQNCGDDKYYEGHYYSTVEIAGDCWFSENCRYLPEVKDYSYIPYNSGGVPTFSSNSIPYFYVYGYEGDYVVDAKATQNYIDYGALYNFTAITSEDICPSGWHVATELDFENIVNAFGVPVSGYGYDSGNELKSIGWDGNNLSGFDGLGGGFVGYASANAEYLMGHWWSSTPTIVGGAPGGETLELSYGSDYSEIFPNQSELGMSARCVKD